jgi:hypothetical protein
MKNWKKYINFINLYQRNAQKDKSPSKEKDTTFKATIIPPRNGEKVSPLWFILESFHLFSLI